jgi:hypothetical protein
LSTSPFAVCCIQKRDRNKGELMSNLDLTKTYRIADAFRQASNSACSECNRQLFMLYHQRQTLNANREKRQKRELQQSAELRTLYESLGIPQLAVS